MYTLPANKDWPTVKNEIYVKNVMWAKALAVSRFEWGDVPTSLRISTLELGLLLHGKMSVTTFNGNVVVGQVGAVSRYNVYREPIIWETVLEDGTMINSTSLDSVICYDTVSRTPTWPVIDVICKKTTSIEVTEEWNSDDQRNPFLYKCPKKKIQTMKALFKRMRDGEKAIIGDDILDDSSVSVINPQVKFISDKLETILSNRRAELYRFLGIEHIPYEKRERMIVAEAETLYSPVEIRRADFLNARTSFCEKARDVMGLNISVRYALKGGGFNEDDTATVSNR